MTQSLYRVIQQLLNEPKTSWSNPWTCVEHASVLWMACVCHRGHRSDLALLNLQKPFGTSSNRLASRLIANYPNCFRVSWGLSVPIIYIELHLCFGPHIFSLSIWCRQPLWVFSNSFFSPLPTLFLDDILKFLFFKNIAADKAYLACLYTWTCNRMKAGKPHHSCQPGVTARAQPCGRGQSWSSASKLTHKFIGGFI